ncbi:VIT1/CCC1 transporter family protein [Brachybacterium sp. JHP9]|uniref:VIT1/CCC1 transporter family protein n=1 Tax=Brachybacterium equifaecis TaxID=2910770 RepID=A0ABT0R054_9MICO|nr:VIT1/CCC1 transporter family protein [Brachybacterium equifaecis]MCL6423299.1 VIT1/CCC1 transporter family protein [Brachybacterium equifaecis]
MTASEITDAPAPAPAGDPENLAGRLNQLRAAVLGANDGIVSVAAVVVGVAGATAQIGPILTAGAAAVIGGAVSMALGEYVSVSSQRDALLDRRAKGHAVDDEELVSAWAAAGASFAAFFIGAILPMAAILLPPASVRIPVTFAATLLALAITGAVAAGIGGGSKLRAAMRVVIGGALALAVTFLVGSLLGSQGVI